MHWHRLYFLIVSGFTAWVGWFGFVEPGQILRALVWPLPPLHARFVGALYVSATVFLLLAAAMHSRAAVEAIVRIALAWTGWLLLITIAHRDLFDPARAQTWFWVVAYVSFPIAAAWLTLRRRPALPALAERVLPRWAASLWGVQAVVYLCLGLALTFLPAAISAIWPWPISALLAQLYSGPVIGWGVGCLYLARRSDRDASLAPAAGLLVFAALALLGSTWHLAVFTAGRLSSAVWFGCLLAILIAALSLLRAALPWSRTSTSTGLTGERA